MNAAKVYTVVIPKTSDYYAYAEEVERIMTNLETTDQFKAANKRWSKDKKKEYGTTMTVSAHTQGTPTVRVDADGDTVMALTQPSGSRSRGNGDRASGGKKQRAKWVDLAEREKRRENRLCFRCGGAGHRIRDCPFAPAVQPTKMNITGFKPLLEDDEEETESDKSEAGKE